MFEGIMQPMHLVVILIIALLFFGPSKLAGLGKGLGDGIRQFKDAVKGRSRLRRRSETKANHGNQNFPAPSPF